MKEQLLIFSQEEIFSENNYYSKKIIYERVPNYNAYTSNGHANVNRWQKSSCVTFDIMYIKNLSDNELTNYQIQNYKFIQNANYHLDENTANAIEEIVNANDNTYSSYYSFYHPNPTRRSWDKSYYNGLLNTEKCFIDIIQEIKKELVEILSSNRNLKEKLLKIISIFDREDLSNLLEVYYEEIKIEINIIIQEVKQKVQDNIGGNSKIIEKILSVLKSIILEKSKIKTFQLQGKNGNIVGANSYVRLKFNNRLIDSKLIKKYEHLNPILLPILSPPKLLNHTENEVITFFQKDSLETINLIPLAYAFAIQKVTGWEIDLDINKNAILKINHPIKSRRQSKPAWKRFAKPSFFNGKVYKGRHYIIIDDNITLGTSVRDLQEYIEINGGYVIRILSLDKSRKTLFDNRLKPNKKELLKTKNSSNQMNDYFIKILGYERGVECLTKQELQALKKTKHFKYKCLRILNENHVVNDKYINLTRKKIINKLNSLKQFAQ